MTSRKTLRASDTFAINRSNSAIAQIRGQLEPLTRREVEVLIQVAQGKRNNQIAQELCLSVLTIQNHLHHIYRKLGVTSRTQAALYATSRAVQEK